MLYSNRIYVSEGIDVNKTSASKKRDIFYYRYFLNYNFNFQPNVCNRCFSFFHFLYPSFFLQNKLKKNKTKANTENLIKIHMVLISSEIQLLSNIGLIS